jgi:hypothetical protein
MLQRPGHAQTPPYPHVFTKINTNNKGLVGGSKREHRTHSGTRVARSVRRLVAGCAAGCGCLDSARCAAGCSIRHLADSAADAADLNAHPLSPRQEDLEVRRSVNSLRSICSGLAPSADHDSEVAIHAGRLIRLKQTQTETAGRYEI